MENINRILKILLLGEPVITEKPMNFFPKEAAQAVLDNYYHVDGFVEYGFYILK